MPLPSPTTIAGLAKASGVAAGAIRRYQQAGLLPKPRRRPGRDGTVAYHNEHLERLILIQRAQRLGFSLEAIAEMLGVGGGLRTCADVDRVAERHLTEVRSHAPADEVRRLEEALVPLLEASPRSGSARNSPIMAMLSDLA
jgi:MerR family mercuric resistance operon transcriptional regulator